MMTKIPNVSYPQDYYDDSNTINIYSLGNHRLIHTSDYFENFKYIKSISIGPINRSDKDENSIYIPPIYGEYKHKIFGNPRRVNKFPQVASNIGGHTDDWDNKSNTDPMISFIAATGGNNGITTRYKLIKDQTMTLQFKFYDDDDIASNSNWNHGWKWCNNNPSKLISEIKISYENTNTSTWHIINQYSDFQELI